MHIQQTIQWINSFVIALNLCPFAKREMESGSARIQVSPSTTVENGLINFMTEIDYLNIDNTTDTSLLLFPHLFSDFFEYLDFVHLANIMLVQAGYKGVYQLATFHPNYCFDGTSVDDVTNYTNRSPYPMLHILREESLDRAIAYYGNTEAIPENNIIRLRNLGLDEVKKCLKNVK
jgi:hypothetical protein